MPSLCNSGDWVQASWLTFIVNSFRPRIIRDTQVWGCLWGCSLKDLTEQARPTLNVGSSVPWAGVLEWCKGETFISEHLCFLTSDKVTIEQCHTPAAMPSCHCGLKAKKALPPLGAVSGMSGRNLQIEPNPLPCIFTCAWVCMCVHTRVLMCSPGWPWVHSGTEMTLNSQSSHLTSPVLSLQACPSTAGYSFLIWNLK